MDRVTCRDALYGFGRDRYNEAVQALGLTGEVRYGGRVYKVPVAADTYWSRVTTRVVAEVQETLRNGTRRFRSDGLVFVQVFCPITDSRALACSDPIAEYVRNAFRTYQGEDLEFTNPWINDNIPPSPDQEWLQVNVTSNYAYRQFI